MAAGQPLATWGPSSMEGGTATLDVRNGHPCVDFDTTTQETFWTSFVLPPHYSGGSIKWKARVGATTATSGGIVFDGALERIDDTLDVDADSFATAAQASALTAPSTSGQTRWIEATLSSGALDGVVAGDLVRFRLRRVPADAGDTATGDAEVYAFAIYEA